MKNNTRLIYLKSEDIEDLKKDDYILIDWCGIEETKLKPDVYEYANSNEDKQ